jgi:DNA-binding NarL/FixJ family response regulator
MIKILIADDHAVVRRGLHDMILDAGDMRVAGEAASHPETLRLTSEGDFDLVILDLNMPGGNGLDTLKQIKILKPTLPVLVLSFRPEKQYAARVLKTGGAGYLTKDSAADEMLAAIRKVLAGGTYVSSALAEQLAQNLFKDPEKPIHDTLSNREYQVLCLIASGHTVSDISQEMSLSIKTVSTYRTRILQKLSMHNNSELTRYAIENGLID